MTLIYMYIRSGGINTNGIHMYVHIQYVFPSKENFLTVPNNGIYKKIVMYNRTMSTFSVNPQFSSYMQQ